ncbi:MAG: hypothetical protein IJY53_10265 [Akkermansia sp.]|nr:hypothetical protein [Akkermansia sp.]
MNEFSPEQPQAARQFSSVGGTHDPLTDESGLSIEPTPAESRQSTMSTDATDRLAIGEIGAEAPSELHTNEQAGSHDCELVVAPTGQGITASLEARAGRTLLPADQQDKNNRKEYITMFDDTVDNLAPGEDGAQEQNSCPEPTPKGSNVVAASCDQSPVIDGNIESTTPVSSEAKADSALTVKPNDANTMHNNNSEKVSSGQAEEDAQADKAREQIEQQSVDGNTNACAAPPDEAEQVSSPQAEPPSAVSSNSPNDAVETSVSDNTITNTQPTITNTMSTNNDIPTVPADDESAATQMNNATAADVESATGSSTTNTTAAALASANLNSGTDCATTSDTTVNINTNNVVAPVSEGESFEPVFLSGGHPCDAMGVGPITRDVGGGAFEITKANARIQVKLTVDDGGTLTLRHQESQQEFSFGASLPAGEWPLLDNPDYWQTDVECNVPKGHYTVTGSVTNTGKAHSQNRIMMRYEIYLVAGNDTIDPIPPDEPEEETMICCACGGCEEKDGNGNVIATIDLPGESFMDQCFLKSQFEEMQQQTAAVSEGDDDTTTVTVSGGLKYTSAWNWNAAYNADNSTISVTPPNGPALNFAIVEGSSTASLTGNSRKYQYSMQLLDEDGNPVTSVTPDVLKLVAADGTQVRFDAESGDVLTIRTSSGRLVSAEQFGNNVSIKTDANKFIQSAYSATDGLMLTSTQSNGSTQYAWYAPEQVTVVGDEYQTSGAPYKTENYLTTVTNGVKTTVITRQQTGLPAHTITRVENGNTTTITKGTGDEAIIRTIAKNYLGNNVQETIESVSRANDTVPAICTRKLELRTDGGWVILEQTEGYGSDVAQTTKYEYDSHFRVSRVNYHNGGYNRFEYDSEGREVLAAEPWAGGYEKITRTTYADSRFYDNRPATVTEYRVNSAGSEVLFRTTTYTYEDSDTEEKVTATVIAGGSTQQQVSISSNYGEAAAYAYAAGKAKFSQAVNGVQTWHDYEATTEHGAIHKHTVTTKADGELVAAQSRKTEEFIASDDTITFEQESIWDGTQWLLLNTTAYEYDAQHRVTKTTRGNGRFSTTEWMCCGVLRQVDEDGIVTSNAYNSAHELTETSRSEVYDGDICVTPETITEYTRDAAGRVLSTTRRIGAMVTTESTEYDALGREIKQVDVLGRETMTEYSEDGLTTTVTTLAGATLITIQNTDGSTARVTGTGQREQVFVYDLSGNSERMTTQLSDGATISQSITNGFGQTVVEARPNTLNGFIYTRSEFNAKGQVIKTYQDTGWNTEKTAATLYEYDTFGNQVKQTLALSDTPTKYNSPMVELVHSVELAADGVYSVTTQTRYNADGAALNTTHKQLISQLSSNLKSKTISTDVRGNNSVYWDEYTAPVKVTSLTLTPTSNITAEVVSVDGLTISQKDHAGIITGLAVQSFSTVVDDKTITAFMYRRYSSSGLEVKQRDGRGNVTTISTDIAGRVVSMMDAANATTITTYDTKHNLPSVITDAMGNTSCYKYDARGRKIAEWGTALQPACFGYDDMDNMTMLRTFRADSEAITTDPSERTDGDVTTWEFDAKTGLEVSKTYADNTTVVKTYDAYNRLATETDARGNVKTHSYEHTRGLNLGTSYTLVDDTAASTARSFTYNHLGQMVQQVDDAGTRTFGYNSYGELEIDRLVVDGDTHLITELNDSFGRSTGYTYTKNGTVQQTVTTGYGDDGRIASTGFLHGGAAKNFSYTYLAGTNLLQVLTKPNGMTLTQTYEATRDLLTGIAYHRGSTLVAQRSYTYDILGHPTARNTARQGTVANDTFTHNTRSELIEAQVNGKDYEYTFDNIGNRTTAVEESSGVAICTEYVANQLNQYTTISENGAAAFDSLFDTDGNQTIIKTTTGIWAAIYNAENRPVLFTNSESNTVVECAYDSMGRRAYKKVTVNGEERLHQRYIYRGYLQIACIDLTRTAHPALWYVTWDPTQPISTRPLAIQINGTWHTYGWDLTKNILELYSTGGTISTSYTYAPFGLVTIKGSVEQPIQWSSEFNDKELGLYYYVYRHYNPRNGSWLGRDAAGEDFSKNLYAYCQNAVVNLYDSLGLAKESTKVCHSISQNRNLTLPKAAFAFLSAFGVYGASAKFKGELSYCTMCCGKKTKGYSVSLKSSYTISAEVGSSSISWGGVKGRLGWYANASGAGALSTEYNSCSNSLKSGGSIAASIELGLVVSLDIVKALSVGGKGGLNLTVKATAMPVPRKRAISVDLTLCGAMKFSVWFTLGITKFFSYTWSKNAEISDCKPLGNYIFEF